MTDSTNDDIRKQVQDRIDQEAAQSPPGDEADDSKITSKLINECLFANELGDGTLFAHIFRGRFLYVKNTQEWFEWNGHYWQRDIMSRVLAAVEQVVQAYLDEYKKIALEITNIIKSESDDTKKIEKLKRKQAQLLKRASQLRGDKRRTACLKFAHTIENPLAITGDEMDQKPWLLACPNGVIDLNPGKQKEGKPADHISMASPVEWKGIDEPAPLWEKTLGEIFHNNLELISFIKRYLGYCLTGSTRDNVFLLLHGQGRNGKTLLASILSYVLGPLARPIPSEMLLDQGRIRNSAGPSPDIMMLRALRIAFASESDEGRRFNAGRIKLFSGGDELTGRNPHDKHPITFTPTHKLMLLTNEKPAAPASDFAFWERLLLVPFTVSFVSREPQKANERKANRDLLAQLQKEAPGILAWLVWGCLEWQREGLNPPRSVTEATEQYRRDEDIIADFIDERCVVEPGAVGFSSEIYSAFAEWYESNLGKRVPSQNWLGKQLHKTYEKTKRDGRIAYFGIAVR